MNAFIGLINWLMLCVTAQEKVLKVNMLVDDKTTLFPLGISDIMPDSAFRDIIRLESYKDGQPITFAGETYFIDDGRPRGNFMFVFDPMSRGEVVVEYVFP